MVLKKARSHGGTKRRRETQQADSVPRVGTQSPPMPDAPETTMSKNGFPQGWDEERVRRVLEHYEEQSEDEALPEDEATFEDQTHSVMEVPVELVPTIRELIAKHAG